MEKGFLMVKTPIATVQNFVYATNYVFLSFGKRISRSLAQDSLFMKRERAGC